MGGNILPKVEFFPWVFSLSFLLEFCPWVLVFSAAGVKKKSLTYTTPTSMHEKYLVGIKFHTCFSLAVILSESGWLRMRRDWARTTYKLCSSTWQWKKRSRSRNLSLISFIKPNISSVTNSNPKSPHTTWDWKTCTVIMYTSNTWTQAC